VTHAYHHFKTACICGEQPKHHIHTGNRDTCPCGKCELDRELAALFGWLTHLSEAQVLAWEARMSAAFEEFRTGRGWPTAYEDVPATFKPLEQQ
jgi:hypothetical protein